MYEHTLLKITDKRILLEVEERECPECKSTRFRLDQQYHLYCQGCGLVLATIYPYTAGIILDLPWGLLI